MKKILKVILLLIAVCVLTYSISKLAFLVSDILYPLFSSMNPDNVFIYISLHHIIQAIIAFTIIYLIVKINKAYLSDIGFNTKEWKFSLTAVLIFGIVWAIVQFGIAYIMTSQLDYAIQPSFPHNAKNIMGVLLFQLLLSGTSEEILFRALTMVCFIFILRINVFDNKKSSILYIVVSTVIFMLNHINFTIFPFGVVNINYLQLLTCMVFGVFYSWLYVKTKSIIGPMTVHGLLNVIIVLSEVVFCSL